MESTGDALDAGILKYTSGSVVGKGGFIDTANQRLNVHHVLPVLEPAELPRSWWPSAAARPSASAMWPAS
jgi:hypothetical protein